MPDPNRPGSFNASKSWLRSFAPSWDRFEERPPPAAAGVPAASNAAAMLAFHDELQRDLSNRDSLVVLARGLGMPHAFARLVAATVSPDALIIGLNVSRPVATQVIFPLLSATPSAHPTLLLPRYLSADYPAKDRAHVYATGGFLVATSAVLVHDLLHGALPPARIAGVAVYAADAVRTGSNEHFVLKLYRAGNAAGYVHAFSEAAPALSRGFHPAEKLMRALYVSRLSLWPRFHVSVKAALARAPDLVDLSVALPPRMAALVSALRACVSAVLTDLRLATGEVDFSELYRGEDGGRKVLVYNFDDVVRRQVEGREGRASSRVRALVADLTSLRTLLRDAFEVNAVAFYQHVVTVRHAAERGNSWLVRKEAQKAVQMARARVWIVRKVRPVADTATDEETLNLVGEDAEVELGLRGASARTVPMLESTPKWGALRDVLREIQADVETVGANGDVGRVLVAVREQRTVDELTTVLKCGDRAFLHRQFEATFPSVAQRARESEAQNKADDGMLQMTLTQLANPDQPRLAAPTYAEVPERRKQNHRSAKRQGRRREAPTSGWRGEQSLEELQEVFREVQSDCSTKIEILLWCMEWVDLQGRGHRVLDEYRPAFVVLYNTDLAVVREVEVYKAANPGRPVRLYLLSYDDAAEEERFRRASNIEKAAFKSLIRERATMSVHVNQEGRERDEEFTQSLLDHAQEDVTPSGRKGLGTDRDSRKLARRHPEGAHTIKGGKVLVDTRELRSTLPMLLYQSKITIVPLTLEVGDFILSKNIGIERKSVPDLYGSFGSGRLFNQAEALSRHYKYPCLLIELDASKSMSLTATSGGVPSQISATSIVSKMVLLMQEFPSLRLLWAKGPHDAAEMFPKLKANEEEPDEELAAALGVDSKDPGEEQFNAGPRALLRSLPGVDSQNIFRVMRKVRNVSTLLTMSKAELEKVLGSVGKATQLYNFVNEQPTEALAAL